MQQLTDVQEIKRAIMFGTFTNDDLNSIGDAIRFARAQLSKQTIRSVVKGDTVKFRNSRTGGVTVGTVEKVAIKYVTVRESHPGRLISSMWKVPANMLEIV